jgi:hypothetical protein
MGEFFQERERERYKTTDSNLCTIKKRTIFLKASLKEATSVIGHFAKINSFKVGNKAI